MNTREEMASVRELVETDQTETLERILTRIQVDEICIPDYPPEGFYATTVAKAGRRKVTSAKVEQILARPTWTFDAALERAEEEMVKKGWRLATLIGTNEPFLYHPIITAERLER